MEFWSVFQGMSVPSLWTEIFYFIQMSSSLSKRRMTSLKFVEFHIILPYHFILKKAFVSRRNGKLVHTWKPVGPGGPCSPLSPARPYAMRKRKSGKSRARFYACFLFMWTTRSITIPLYFFQSHVFYFSQIIN